MAAAATALVVTGCGGGGGDSSTTAAATAPPASDFPAPDGRTLDEIAKSDGGSQSDLVAAPASQVFRAGEDNRYGFGVFNVDGSSVRGADVAVYAAQPGKPAEGPYPATAETLDVAAPYQSKTAATDPDAAKDVYVSQIPFQHKGEYQLLAMFKDGNKYSYTSISPSAVVGQFDKVPAAGDAPPKIHTLTTADVGGDVSKIDTRQPPTTMHKEDFADVVGKKPVVLLFATPALCQSRVCGPVADITEEVHNERPNDAAYIMQEIYNDNQVNKGTRPQVNAFHLPSEPWLFVIGSDGKISTEIEGAFSKAELEAALDKVNGGSSANSSG